MKCLICLTRKTMDHWNICDACARSIISHWSQQNPEVIDVRWLNE